MPEMTRNLSHLKLLAVYAHPDDETFCAGGTLAKYAAAGAEILVVSMTRGEAGQIRDAYLATRRTLGTTRVLELQRACRQLGVSQVMCLDYGDGKLAALDPAILVAKTTELIRSFRPDIVLTFGNDGAYGHPDHIAVGAATDEAFQVSGDPSHAPEHLAAGLSPHTPAQLYHSYFPRSPGLLLEHLVNWLKTLDTRFCGNLDFVRGLVVLAEETTTSGYSSDNVRVEWYPPGFYIVEQGEPAMSLYLILSGQADVIRELPDGRVEKLNEIGPGFFFGEDGLATQRPRNAHIIAHDSVSCLVLSPSEPKPFVGRGTEAQYTTHAEAREIEPVSATTRIDVSDFVPQKVAAIASHRTQCPIEPGMLPDGILREIFAYEYFIRIHPRVEMATEFWLSNHD